MSTRPEARLQREVGLPGAIIIGLGSILGTGVFVSIGIAAGVAGPSVLLAIVIAAFVALCNGLSSAQLAASHPVSGGTYEYGYKYLSPTLGFTAGWMFLCAKSASAATAALGVAGYGLHLVSADGKLAQQGVAIGAVVVVTALVLTGLKRSNAVNAIVVTITIGSLLAFMIASGFSMPMEPFAGFDPFWSGESGLDHLAALFSASALMFVAFTGYGRIATMGEELKSPARTIPKAIVFTLVVAAILYLAIGFTAIRQVGASMFASFTSANAAPLELIAHTFSEPSISEIVGIGALAAMLGVLLNLVLGLSRVVLAMGRRADLPRKLGHLGSGSAGNPRLAVVAVGVIIAALTLLGDVKVAWSFSAVTVLIYYGLTNLAALRLPSEYRRFSSAWAWMGLTACIGLAVFVQWPYWVAAVGVLAVGFGLRFTVRRLSGPAETG